MHTDSNPVPILDFWGPYAKLCRWRGVRVGGVKEWMKRICPCFTQSRIALTESARETVSSAARYTFIPLFFFSPQTRDCTTFTLHDLTDFCVETVTAHRIKRNDHSCFHNSWPNSKTKLKLKHLWEQGGPLGVSGALRSLRILRIGRIGSALTTNHLMSATVVMFPVLIQLTTTSHMSFC